MTLLPQRRVEVGHRHAVVAARRAGVVDDDVDAAEALEDLVGQRVDGSDVGHVGHRGQHLDAERRALVGDRVDVPPAGGLLVVGVASRVAAGAGEHDVAAGPGQLDGDRPADRAHPARPGDHCDLAVETHPSSMPWLERTHDRASDTRSTTNRGPATRAVRWADR